MVRTATVDNGCGELVYPLSPMQQGMLFHCVRHTSPGVDVEQVICELDHPISTPEFEQAWNLIVRRHDTLRTSFIWHEGEEPRQKVEPPDAVTLPIRILHMTDHADAAHVVEQYLVADRKAGFSALAAPLARIALFLVDEHRSYFVFTYHHLVLDARGMYTLFKEALEYHDALARGETLQIEPVRPYRDYVAWLQTLDARRAEAFWREQFQGLAGPTALPLPQPVEAPAADDAAPGELATRIKPDETSRLRAAAARHGVTLNTLLQGAWALVLSRYTGEDDVVFGAVRACRHVPVEGATGMIGMLINTVPLRVRLASAASVDHWLRGLREQWTALRDYEHTSLMQVQTWANVAAGRPLFDTLFNFQEPSWIGGLRRLGGIWSHRSFDIRSQPGYPLALDIYGDEALLIRAFYERSRFSGAAVARLLGHFRAAIEALADVRTDTLGQVSLLSAAERSQLVVGFNRTAADYPRDLTVHEACAAWARTTPEAVAVTDAEHTLTYAELDARAEALAGMLRKRGVDRDVVVAVCMTRSVAMIVSWLAVLKAGGAFVPLDPGYPPERLAFQLRDCGAPVLLTQPHVRGVLPALPAGVVAFEIAPDGAAPANGTEPGLQLTPPRGPGSDALAYVIYTSGSTGQPKGVEVEHRALMNLVTWHKRAYSIIPEDRATHVASPAFDAAVWEIWPYLASGASVHIPDDETRISPASLWRWMAEMQITVAFLPTPLAEAALSELVPEKLALRVLLTGGDELKRRPPAGFDCALVNHYGPTENTVVATAGAVPRGETGRPPIGKPIANTAALVLDREMRLVPIGAPGELYLGGESLARGYRNRPELTAERFVPDPFSKGAPHSAESPVGRSQRADRPPRLYRTGDLVRWREDGQLEFLGRMDHQVKIRGCRIELGEVEAALQRHAAVRDAVALVRNDAAGHAQLVAYVVPVEAGAGAPAGPAQDSSGDGSPAARIEREIVAMVRQQLPAYMVPAAIVVLEQWPLTNNGKIDRAALPPPRVRGTPAEADALSQGPGGEQQIARIFAEVLGRPSIGRDENFFELGGHSLLAAQALTRLNAALGASISVRVLFDHPTVAGFANAIAQQATAGRRVPALRPMRRAAAPELELAQPR